MANFPIFSANTISLTDNPGTLPNMSETIMGWFQNIAFTVITKTVVNFQLVEIEVQTSFMGVVESQTAEQLVLKPEGQRSWNWINVWALPSLVMKNDDIFLYKGIRYRVMNKHSWNEYGYLQYEAVEDYVSGS